MGQFFEKKKKKICKEIDLSHFNAVFSLGGNLFCFGAGFFWLVYLQFGQFFTNMSTINSRSFFGMITNNVTHIQYFFYKKIHIEILAEFNPKF